MPKLPRPTGRQMVQFLKEQGFSVIRVRGSHHVLRKDTLRTTVPVHGSANLRIGTLRGILRDVELSAMEFGNLGAEVIRSELPFAL